MYSLRWLRLAALGALMFSAAAASDELIDAAAFCGAEGGCAAVRSSALGRVVGPYLPWAGVLVYSLVFAGTLQSRRKVRRPFLWLAAAGGVAALALLIAQWVSTRTLCELCLGTDVAGLLVGAFALLVLRRPAVRQRSWPATAWLALWILAVGLPPVVALSRPNQVPDYVRKHLSGQQVTIVEVSDFQCPYCRKVHGLLAELIDGRDDVQVVRLPYPLRSHPHSFRAAKAYLCAEAAGMGEAFAARLFGGDNLRLAALLQHASAVGMDPANFRACLHSSEKHKQLRAIVRELSGSGVDSVPLVWINDHRIAGFRPEAGAAPYAQALARAGSGQPARKVPVPFIALGVVVAILVTWAGRSTLRGQEV